MFAVSNSTRPRVTTSPLGQRTTVFTTMTSGETKKPVFHDPIMSWPVFFARSTKQPLNVFKGHRKAVSYVKFLSSEDIVSASTDSQLKLWNVNQSHCARSFTGETTQIEQFSENKFVSSQDMWTRRILLAWRLTATILRVGVRITGSTFTTKVNINFIEVVYQLWIQSVSSNTFCHGNKFKLRSCGQLVMG